MTLSEASKIFNVSEKEIANYETKGYIKRSDKEYKDADFKYLGIIQTLLSVEMGKNEINKYLKLLDRESIKRSY